MCCARPARRSGCRPPPFLGPYFVQVDPLALLAAAVLGAGVWLAPRALALRPAAFGVATLIATLVVRLAVNAARTGTSGWDRMLDPFGYFEGKNEYLPALRALQYGPHFLLDRFAELVPSLPPHAAATRRARCSCSTLGITTPAGMAALCIAAGALATPLAYLTARAVADEQRARLPLLLVASPDAILFSVSSADAIYLFFGMLAAWPLATFARRGGALPLLTGAVDGGRNLLRVVAARGRRVGRADGGLRRGAAIALACGIATVGLYAVLWAVPAPTWSTASPAPPRTSTASQWPRCGPTRTGYLARRSRSWWCSGSRSRGSGFGRWRRAEPARGGDLAVLGVSPCSASRRRRPSAWFFLGALACLAGRWERSPPARRSRSSCSIAAGRSGAREIELPVRTPSGRPDQTSSRTGHGRPTW